MTEDLRDLQNFLLARQAEHIADYLRRTAPFELEQRYMAAANALNSLAARSEAAEAERDAALAREAVLREALQNFLERAEQLPQRQMGGVGEQTLEGSAKSILVDGVTAWDLDMLCIALATPSSDALMTLRSRLQEEVVGEAVRHLETLNLVDDE